MNKLLILLVLVVFSICCTGIVRATTSTDFITNLSMHLSFDNWSYSTYGSYNITKSSQNISKNATIQGTFKLNSPGKLGEAVNCTSPAFIFWPYQNFNGVTGNQWSINYWYKSWNPTSGYHMVWRWRAGDNTQNAYQEFMNNNLLSVYMGEGAGTITFPGTGILGTWHMLTVVANSTVVKTYVDGTFNTSMTYTAQTMSVANINICEYGSVTNGEPGVGEVDEFSLWLNRVLTATQITELYNNSAGLNYSDFGTPPDNSMNIINSSINVTSAYVNNTVWRTDYQGLVLTKDSTPTVIFNMTASVNCTFSTLPGNYTNVSEFDANYKCSTPDTTAQTCTLPYALPLNTVTDVYIACKRTDGTNETELSTSGPMKIMYGDVIPPTCQLISRSPSAINTSSNGLISVLFNCTDSNGINTTIFSTDHSLNLITRTLDSFIVAAGIPNYWSIRYPSNNLGTNASLFPTNLQILRAEGRNRSFWYESASIDGIKNDTFSYAVEDGHYGKLNTTVLSATTVLFNYTDYLQPAVFRQSVILSWDSMVSSKKYNFSVTKNAQLLLQRYDIEAYRNTSNYTMSGFRNVKTYGTPTRDLRVFYCNSSYNPKGGVTVVTSPNCVLLQSASPASIVTVLTDRNSSYSTGTHGVENMLVAGSGVRATAVYYVYYETTEPNVGKGYNYRYANTSTVTNLGFNETNTSWTSTNQGSSWTARNWTADYFTTTVRSSNDRFEFGLSVVDNLGNRYTNLSFFGDNIGLSNHSISSPTILAYNSSITTDIFDLEGMVKGIMSIKIGAAQSIDQPNNVTHNVTIMNLTGAIVAIVNASFIPIGDIWIGFNTSLLPNGLYKTNITAYNPINTADITSHQTDRNFTIANDISFTGIPASTIITYGENFSVQFNASSEANWGINWTTKFAINQSGLLNNTKIVTAGNYSINVTINDTLNIVQNSTLYGVTVLKANASIGINVSPASPVVYGVQSMINGTGCPDQLTCNLSYTSINNYYLCYQESANETNQTGIDGTCDLNYGGSAIVDLATTKVWNPEPPVTLYDGNWLTSASRTCCGGDTILNVTYIKPANSIGAIWRVKDAVNDEQNHTLPNSCFNAVSDKILLQVTLSTDFVSTSWRCWDSTNWIYATTNNTGIQTPLYEEAIWWIVSNTTYLSNPHTTIFPAGNYTYTYSTLGNENYTAFSNSTILVVTKNTTNTALTFDVESPQNYLTVVTPTCTASVGTPTLLLNSSTITSGVGLTLAAGTYNFSCETFENENYTGFVNSSIYTINQIIAPITATVTPLDKVEYGTPTTGTGALCPGQVTCSLYLNTTLVANPHTTTLGAGHYLYNYTTPGNQNYTYTSALAYLNVSLANATTALTFDVATPQNYLVPITPTCTASLGTPVLKVNTTTITSGAPIILAAGDYNFTCILAQTENYTGFVNSSLYVINKITPATLMSISGTTPINYGTISDVLGTETNVGDDDLVYTTLPVNQILKAGITMFNYSTQGGQNYTIGSKTLDITVNKISPEPNMALAGTTPINYGTITDVVGSNTNTGDEDCVYVTAPINDVYAAGIKAFNYSTAGGENYTAGIIYANILIVQVNPAMHLYLNNSEFSTTFPSDTIANVTCAINNQQGNINLSLNETTLSVFGLSPQNITREFAPGTYNYTCSYNATQNYTTQAASYLLVVNDTSVPDIHFINTTTEAGNYSQDYIEMNVSVSDKYVNIDTVTHYIYTSLGVIAYEQSFLGNSTVFFYNFTALPDGTWYINSTANDTWGNRNWTETRTITLDTTNPMITWFMPDNGSSIVLINNGTGVNLSLHYRVSDTYLYSTYYNVTNNGVVLQSYVNKSLFGLTSFDVNANVSLENVSGWINVWAKSCDGHTAEDIRGHITPSYITSGFRFNAIDIVFEKSLEAQPPVLLKDGKIGKTPRISMGDLSPMISNLDIWNKKYIQEFDRVSFSITTILPTDRVSFVVSAENSITILNDMSPYPGHLVVDERYWVDFKTTDFDHAEVESIDDTHALVTIYKTVSTNYWSFNSIGELNCMNETRRLFVVNTSSSGTPAYAWEYDDVVFNLATDYNNMSAENMSVQLIMNNTAYNATGTKGNLTANWTKTMSWLPAQVGTGINQTYYWNVSNGLNTTTIEGARDIKLYPILLTFCSSTAGNNTLTFNFKDQSNDSEIFVTYQISLNVWRANPLLFKTFGALGINNTVSVCISPNFAVYNASYIIAATATGYMSNQLDIPLTVLTNTTQNHTMYLAPAGSTAQQVILVDGYGIRQAGWTMMLYRYNLAFDNYTLISSKTTDSIGSVVVYNIITASVSYKLNIYNPSAQNIFNTSTTEFVSNPTYVTIPTSYAGILDLINQQAANQITSNISYNKTGNWLTFTVNASMASGYAFTLYQNMTIIATAMNSTGVITINNPSDVGAFYARGFVTMTNNGKSYPVNNMYFSRGIPDPWQFESPMLVMILWGTIVLLVAYISPEFSLISGIISLGILYWTGIFLPINGYYFVAIAMTLAIPLFAIMGSKQQ